MPKDKINTPPSVPTPPTGYQLTNLPDFIRPANAGTKTVRAESKLVPGGRMVANVEPSDPQTILVREPQLFTQPVQTHESTHVYQLSRNPQFVNNDLSSLQSASPNNYGYGGVEGLEKALQEHKTIADFDMEKQAQIVSDYQRMTTEALQKGDRKGLARITAAYHPFIRQFAQIPAKGVDMTRMTQQDLTPAAPSVPPATVIGVPMQADPLLGGSAAGPKTGDTKRFGNGTIGVWDGHGWRAKRQ